MMVEYDIYFRDELSDDIKKRYTNQINKMIEELEQNVCITNGIDKLAFTVGGDGTFLEAVEKCGLNTLYIPINEGSLGFYTSWNKDNLNDVIKEFKNENIVFAPVIDIEYEKNGEFIKHSCLNEITIINPISTQIATIVINDFEFERFRGTGLCISTPSGSTAYNKSLGGGIMNHTQEAFQLVKIAPINNKKYRTMGNPIIFSKSDVLGINIKKKDTVHSILTVDRLTYNLEGVEKIKFRLSKDKVMFLQSEDNMFWKRVKNSFL